MTNIFSSKTNFSAGEISSDLLGRVDLSAYANGACCLKNVFLEPTGGIHRRSGLRYIANTGKTGRLIAFEQKAEERFLFVIQAGETKIYQHDILMQTLETPWQENQLSQLNWCQVSDGILIVHPKTKPHKIKYQNETWVLEAFSFLTEQECIRQPYVRFCGDEVTMSSSGCDGEVTLTASSDVFEQRHVNEQFKLASGYVQIKSIDSPTQAKASVQKKLLEGEDIGASTKLEATRSWGEPAFCEEKGWPQTVCTYQSRLVFGGSPSLPSTLWFSQTGDVTNFEQGSGYDAQAIEFKILSNQSDHIVALFANRHLQVFTTSAEWMVSGDPLTPSDIQLKRQTQVGSRSDIFVPPLGIDGATIFAAINGREIREFLFSDLEGMYQATDISLLARHLIQTPIDMAYDKYERQAYIVMQNGALAVLTSFRSENLQSWTQQQTEGRFLSVAILGQRAYFLVNRDGQYMLECFDKNLNTDSGVLALFDTEQTEISGLTHLESKQVVLTSDGVVLDKQTVQNGKCDLSIAGKKIEVGLPFEHQVTPLPPVAGASNGNALVSSCRLVRLVLRLIDTQSLEIDTGAGIHQELVPKLLDCQLNKPILSQTKDVVLRCLGWVRTPTQPLWEIKGSNPQPFRLVSLTSDIKLGG